jgi:hypothetical protein
VKQRQPLGWCERNEDPKFLAAQDIKLTRGRVALSLVLAVGRINCNGSHQSVSSRIYMIRISLQVQAKSLMNSLAQMMQSSSVSLSLPLPWPFADLYQLSRSTLSACISRSTKPPALLSRLFVGTSFFIRYRGTLLVGRDAPNHSQRELYSLFSASSSRPYMTMTRARQMPSADLETRL